MRERNTWRSMGTSYPETHETRCGPNGGRFYVPDESGWARYSFQPPGAASLPQNASASSSVRVAIQEQLRFPSDRGIVSAQRVRIFRINQAAPAAHRELSSPVQMSNSDHFVRGKPASRRTLSAQRREMQCRLDGKEVRLRSVGAIAADENGNFYEVEGRRTRRLGRLVMDEQGTIFEVHSADDTRVSGSTRENSSTKPAAGRTAEQPDRADESNAADTAGRQPRSHAPRRPVRPPENAERSRDRAGDNPHVRRKAPEAEAQAPVSRVPPDQRRENAGRQSVASVSQDHDGRCEIPQKYMEPLQFKYSREEVLYDMKSVLGTLPPESGGWMRWFIAYPIRRLKALAAFLSGGRPIKKWRAMLRGKSPDEQLWSVSPPRGFAHHPAVRRWAEERLNWAGYDPERMLLEWEIFWRRKGCS